MNKAFYYLLFFSLLSPALYSKCQEPFPAIEVLGDSLSHNWAHEYIGSDLVKEEIRTIDTVKVNAAVFDTGFEKKYITLTEDIPVPQKKNGRRTMTAHHGTSVLSLLNGPAPYGTTENLNLITLGAVASYQMYRYHFEKFLKNERLPKVVSNSLGWTDPSVADVVQDADSYNILWFLAAGNSWPEPIKDYELNSRALLVGSFAPSGLTSYESQNDPNVLILAPANTQLPAINGDGQRYMFGATSGATPIVAGTAINIASILPSITREQIKKLIQKTALPSMENLLGRKDYPGQLNAYKAFKVAFKIKKNCPDAQSECVDQELDRDNLFRFTTKTLSCAKIKKLSCDDKQKYLKQMRKQALLGNKAQFKELACAYSHLGYSKNAQFYSLHYNQKAPLQSMRKNAVLAMNKLIPEVSYYRYLSFFDSSIIEDINSSKLDDHRKDILKSLHKN